MKKQTKRMAAALVLAAVLLAGCAGRPDSNAPASQPAVLANGPMTPLRSMTTYWAGGPEGACLEISRPDASKNILYIDYATHTGAPLCSQETCAHDSDSCIAWLAKNTNCCLFYWQDKLYMLTDGYLEIPNTLWEIDPDSQERRKLLELESERLITGTVLGQGRNLYFTTMEIRNGQTRQLLCRFNLDECKLTPIHNCLDEDSSLLGGWDGWLLLEVIDPVDPDVPNDLAHVEEYSAAMRARTHSLYRVSTEGDREAEPIFTWDGDCTAAGGYGSLFYLLDTGTGTLTVHDLDTGTEQTLQDDRLRTTRHTDLYIPVSDGALLPIPPEDTSQPTVWYLYHDGQLTASRYQYVGGGALDAPRNRIITDAGDYYLVERNFDSPTYALVPKADYWADSDGATDIPIQVQLPW